MFSFVNNDMIVKSWTIFTDFDVSFFQFWVFALRKKHDCLSLHLQFLTGELYVQAQGMFDNGMYTRLLVVVHTAFKQDSTTNNNFEAEFVSQFFRSTFFFFQPLIHNTNTSDCYCILYSFWFLAMVPNITKICKKSMGKLISTCFLS